MVADAVRALKVLDGHLLEGSLLPEEADAMHGLREDLTVALCLAEGGFEELFRARPATKQRLSRRAEGVLRDVTLFDATRRGELTGTSGVPLAEIQEVSVRLQRHLAREPGYLHSLHWRTFERVVAELLTDSGFQVDLVSPGRDTGVDIFAVQKNHAGKFLYLVQCKKFAVDRPVGLPVVDRIYGRVMADHASAGMVVTTSSFTRGARGFAEQVPFQLSLRDFNNLRDWLKIWEGP
jgi:restriction endonuclease Mrr